MFSSTIRSKNADLFDIEAAQVKGKVNRKPSVIQSIISDTWSHAFQLYLIKRLWEGTTRISEWKWTSLALCFAPRLKNLIYRHWLRIRCQQKKTRRRVLNEICFGHCRDTFTWVTLRDLGSVKRNSAVASRHQRRHWNVESRWKLEVFVQKWQDDGKCVLSLMSDALMITGVSSLRLLNAIINLRVFTRVQMWRPCRVSESMFICFSLLYLHLYSNFSFGKDFSWLAVRVMLIFEPFCVGRWGQMRLWTGNSPKLSSSFNLRQAKGKAVPGAENWVGTALAWELSGGKFRQQFLVAF